MFLIPDSLITLDISPYRSHTFCTEKTLEEISGPVRVPGGRSYAAFTELRPVNGGRNEVGGVVFKSSDRPKQSTGNFRFRFKSLLLFESGKV